MFQGAWRGLEPEATPSHIEVINTEYSHADLIKKLLGEPRPKPAAKDQLYLFILVSINTIINGNYYYFYIKVKLSNNYF